MALGPMEVISSQLNQDKDTTSTQGPHLEDPLSSHLRQVSLSVSSPPPPTSVDLDTNRT